MQKSDTQISIIHIFTDGSLETAEQLIKLQSKKHQVAVVDLSIENINYHEIIDTILSCDKVISW